MAPYATTRRGAGAAQPKLFRVSDVSARDLILKLCLAPRRQAVTKKALLHFFDGTYLNALAVHKSAAAFARRIKLVSYRIGKSLRATEEKIPSRLA